MILFNKYKLLEILNSGSYGTIYKGKNIRTGDFVAIKVEPKTETSLLPNEAKIYIYLASLEGIPQAKWFGVEFDKNILVLDLLDVSLTKMKQVYGNLSIHVTAKIGIQMIQRLRAIHDKELVHRDIKPDNWLFGRGYNKDLLYLIDFGFCKRYKDGAHIPLKHTSNIIGTLNYVSLNIHNKIEPSRRDDIESVIYILQYLLDELPWHNVVDHFLMVELKTNIVFINPFLRELLIYTRQLQFDECPDYDWLVSILESVCLKTVL